jgi:tetratricopeptide (TPR) repeat protein
MAVNHKIMASIDTHPPIHYKVYMKRMTKILWLWIILALSACQASPAPRATVTPAATTTAGPIPTLPTSPAPTPFPTPVPVIRVESGDRALFNGDYDRAREQYLAAFNDSTDRAIQAAALWGMSRTELADGRHQTAIETLTNLTEDYSESTYAARAYFLMGRAYYALKQYQLSADAYDTYLARVPGVLDGYVQEYRGDAFNEIKEYTNALNAYDAALNASRLDDGLTLRIKIAQTRAAFGDYAGALSLYDQIFTLATNDYIKAQMDYSAGNAHIALGQINEANARYLHAVENYPLSYYSYLALVELVDANVPVRRPRPRTGGLLRRAI